MRLEWLGPQRLAHISVQTYCWYKWSSSSHVIIYFCGNYPAIFFKLKYIQCIKKSKCVLLNPAAVCRIWIKSKKEGVTHICKTHTHTRTPPTPPPQHTHTQLLTRGHTKRTKRHEATSTSRMAKFLPHHPASSYPQGWHHRLVGSLCSLILVLRYREKVTLWSLNWGLPGVFFLPVVEF